MAFPGQNYAPPSVYTRTLFENPFSGSLDALKIPVFIGEGNEFLFQRNLELVRGSSASIDQRRVREDMTGRAVASISATGEVSLGSWDGIRTQLQVANLPIVTGDGTGSVTNSRSDVSVTINGDPIVVLSVNGANGVVELAQAPKAGDQVKISYFFNRMDTLVTDDVSNQVSAEAALLRAARGIADVDAQAAGTDTLNIHGELAGGVPANNELLVIVDGSPRQIIVPSNVAYTMNQIANAINAAAAGISLTASTFINNLGLTALQLSAAQDLTILEASLNAEVGLIAGSTSTRTKTFYTFQGPIVTGDNGGVTTTDPSHVTVLVNGQQVIPDSVDGASRAVTLPTAPPVGATVSIRYYFNSWQDTFDYLINEGVTSITSVGAVPDSEDFTQEADFILKDDKILWGTSWAVEAQTTTQGFEQFDDTQVSGLLIDDRTYMSPCFAVVNTTGGVSVQSKREFALPYAPTLGNGRDTPLGSSLFQTVANGRIDVPVNRPDVITAYWGYGIQDAQDRGPVAVVKVEGTVITLSEDVPAGAGVYASFYYNRLTDAEYTIENTLAGISGIGTYEVKSSAGTNLLGASYNVASKGAALAGVTVVFPSGSELTPDLRHESVSDELFVGPVEETVTLEFATRAATPARYSVPGAAPYFFIQGESDHARINLDNVAGSVDPDMAGGGATEALGIDLADPTANSMGFFASLVSDVIDYTGGASSTVGESYDLTTPEDIALFIDGVQVDVTIPAQTTADITDIIASINLHASGTSFIAAAGGAATVQLPADVPNSDVDSYFVGWNVSVGTSVLATDGQTVAVTAHDGATRTLTVAAWAGGAMAAADTARLYNPATMAVMKGATAFNGPTIIDAGAGPRTIDIEYNGDGGAVDGTYSVTLSAGTYNSAAELATELQTRLDAAMPANSSLRIMAGADGDGRIELSVQLDGDDAAAFIRVLPQGLAADDFGQLAGFCAHATESAHLIEGEVAKVVNDGTAYAPGNQHLFDRLVLRNRLSPGGSLNSTMSHHNVANQMELRVGAGSGNEKAGLTNGDFGVGGFSAVVQPATLAANVGVIGGQDGVSFLPVVTFFDGSGATPANNVFEFSVDGVSCQVTFTGSAAGTATAIGPVSDVSSVSGQVVAALAALPDAPFGNAGAITAAGMIRDESLCGFRITSQQDDTTSSVVIGAGSANSAIGFSEGAIAQREPVSAKLLASALNSHRVASQTDYLQDFGAVTGGGNPSFANDAFATAAADVSGNEYLYIESLSQGVSSVVTVRDPVVAGVVTDSWLFPGTGINAVDLDGAVGEAGISGFHVTSNKANGSGSANDSLLNDGTGSDGVVGQTYRDRVTGLTFTILPQNYHDNPNGPWAPYPTGGTATLRFQVSKTFTADANLPMRALPGIETKVANTLNVGVNDTAVVSTYERGGEEPAVGDVYYASYIYEKESYETAYFTKMSSIEQAYGEISSDNPVTLAAYLASLNGAVLMGIKQVPRAEGSNLADLATYRSAIEDLEGVQPGQVNPDVIVPLRGDSTDLFTILKRSNEVQSSIRYKSERTSIIGLSSGSDAKAAQNLAQTLQSDRMRLIYPDTAVISLTDAFGATRQEVVDGTMLAAAMAGSVVSPNVDVATPWTGRNLVGFVQLGRLLDAVEMNQTAQKGVTVIEERPPFLRVRHGLTTDMSNVLRKTPTVRQIADEVQRQSRNVLANFIGVKFIPGILSQVEGRLAMMFKDLVQQQVVAAYTGIKANVAPDDPTVAEVEAFYQPVFPLLYIVLTFHIRASL